MPRRRLSPIKVAAGKIPAAGQAAAEQAAVSQAIQAVASKVESTNPAVQIAADGTVTLDFSDAAARKAFVADALPGVQKQLNSGSGSSVGSSATDDTSFLNGSDKRLSKPFLVAFNDSAVTVYWVAMFVVIIAFILALFFRTPPLRAKSALQEAADDDEAIRAKAAADEAGALVAPFAVVDEDAAPAPVTAVRTVSAPAQPLTRRQLREAQQE